MTHLVVLVLDDPELCPSVLDAWEEAGAGGATILESTGLRRVQNALREDLPLFPSMRDFWSSDEALHRTLFTVVGDEGTVARIAAATERVVGDLRQPHTGLFFVVAVTQVLGLDKQLPKKGSFGQRL